MQLMNAGVAAAIPPLYANEKAAGGEATDPLLPVKFFDPSGSWTWYVMEGEPIEGTQDWLFFGLVDGWDMELGYFRLSDLTTYTGRFGLGIERDLHWSAKTLSEVQGSAPAPVEVAS